MRRGVLGILGLGLVLASCASVGQSRPGEYHEGLSAFFGIKIRRAVATQVLASWQVAYREVDVTSTFRDTAVRQAAGLDLPKVRMIVTFDAFLTATWARKREVSPHEAKILFTLGDIEDYPLHEFSFLFNKRLGRLHILSDPAGFSVLVDHKPVEDEDGRALLTPIHMRVDEGEHLVELSRGKLNCVETKYVNAGRDATVRCPPAPVATKSAVDP